VSKKVQLDDYENIAFYKKNTKAMESGFRKFKVGKQHYFCRYIDGAIALVSQPYQSESGRDNGIESVKKNSKIHQRFKVGEMKNGGYGLSLRAGNHQEIAISGEYKSEAEASHVAGRLSGKTRAKPKAKPKPKPKPKAKPKAVVAKKRNPVEQDYKPLAFYERQAPKIENGFSTFKGEDGKHYFAYYRSGKVELISEGYPTKSAMNTGLESTRKNMALEKRIQYRGRFKNGMYDYRVKAGNGKEVARSRWYKSAAAASAAAMLGWGAAAAMPKTKPAAPADKENDYLPCQAYRGHAVNDKENNIAFFKHANGQFYFVLYDTDGDVRLRSEGFRTAKERDQELSGVVRLKDEEKYYKRMEKGQHYIDVLYDEKGREVGRSCLRKIAVAPVAVAPAAVAPAAVAPADAPVTAAAPVAAVANEASGGGLRWLLWLLPLLLLALLLLFGLKNCQPKAVPVPVPVSCWDGSEAKTLGDCPKEVKVVTCWDGSEAPTLEACPVEVRTVTCWDGSEAATQDACPVEVTTVTCWDGSEARSIGACPKEPVAPKPIVQVISGGQCGPSDNPLFNVPSFATPENVTRLGTFPQFGDSHGLSPQEFYDKLALRYNSSSFDAAYLNLVFRSLGYRGGFSEANASMFSAVSLPQGTQGVLGYGDFHGNQYSKLNVTSARDLEAFNVRAANGRNVNFMKSCGNFMYVCQ